MGLVSVISRPKKVVHWIQLYRSRVKAELECGHVVTVNLPAPERVRCEGCKAEKLRKLKEKREAL